MANTISITADDVGRQVRMRNGYEDHIVSFEPGFEYPVRGSEECWTSEGNWRAGATHELSYDIVAFVTSRECDDEGVLRGVLNKLSPATRSKIYLILAGLNGGPVRRTAAGGGTYVLTTKDVGKCALTRGGNRVKLEDNYGYTRGDMWPFSYESTSVTTDGYAAIDRKTELPNDIVEVLA